MREFFASQPLQVNLTASNSCRHIVSELLQTVSARRGERHGGTVVGAVMRYLVAAKLNVAVPDLSFDLEGLSLAEDPGKRKGDFLVHDTAIHVTKAPSKSLLSKCCRNLEENIRPLIITTKEGADAALELARNVEVEDRIDVIEIDQFIAVNILACSHFSDPDRSTSIEKLITAYNEIIDTCETDPSLRISTE